MKSSISSSLFLVSVAVLGATKGVFAIDSQVAGAAKDVVLVEETVSLTCQLFPGEVGPFLHQLHENTTGHSHLIDLLWAHEQPQGKSIQNVLEEAGKKKPKKEDNDRGKEERRHSGHKPSRPVETRDSGRERREGRDGQCERCEQREDNVAAQEIVVNGHIPRKPLRFE